MSYQEPIMLKQPETTNQEVYLFPASYAQKSIWFMQQFAPDSPVYNIPFILRFFGRLDEEVLERCLREIIYRHEVLRTSFMMQDDLMQVITPEVTVSLPKRDLRHLPLAEKQQELFRRTERLGKAIFDLSQSPLIRFELLRLEELEYALIVNVHHIVFDIGSKDIFVNELMELYEALSQGKSPQLPEISAQYADYAYWQKEWLESEGNMEQLLTYWKKRLGGELPVLQLPTDFPRKAAQQFDGRLFSFHIPQSFIPMIKSLCQEEGATPFVILLSAFKAFLYRYTELKDILVGIPFSMRNQPELEPLIGFFVNTLVIRSSVSKEVSFRELLRRVKTTFYEAIEYQDVPFEKLVEALDPERNSSHHPIFQVMFSYHRLKKRKTTASTIQVEVQDFDNRTSKFDLGLLLVEQDHGIDGWFEYRSDLFLEETIQRMSNHFIQLLGSLLSQPDQSIHSHEMVTEEEKHFLIYEVNQTAFQYPADKTVHQLIKEQAQKTPHLPAVVFKNESLTYEELDRCSEYLAYQLQQMNVQKGDRVGISVMRSLDMIVAIVGTLKAGAVYVPLDPSYPKERLSYMINDAEISVLLTQKQLLSVLPQVSCPVLMVEEVKTDIDLDAMTEVKGTGDDLAYIIYTSGTTGKPKGVPIRHSSLVNHLLWMKQEYPLTEKDRFLQNITYGFDASLTEIFAPLISGAVLVLSEPHKQSDIDYLIHVIQSEQITRMQMVPSLLIALLNHEDFHHCKSLTHIFCGGEPLANEWCQRLSKVSNAKVINLYGPTEACIVSTHRLYQGEKEDGTVPIGKPTGNVKVYVLDSEKRLVPIGVPGELYIGGDGLSPGYWKRPELTAERFISNPFDPKGKSRLYKTGDWVQMMPNGELKFLQRMDNQVKIRGYRIELEEIQRVLQKHPLVREAVVQVKKISADDKIVAYLTLQEGLEWRYKLKSYLRSQLPEYMIPSFMVRMNEFPTTPNGKIDIQALPLPDETDGEQAYVAPRDLLEHEMTLLWEEILGIKRIGVKDDFFSIGGHSLKAAELMASIRQKFHVHLPVSILFNRKSIAELCEVIREQVDIGKECLVSLQKGKEQKPPLFLIHPGGGGVLCYSELVHQLEGLTIYGLQSVGYESEEEPLEDVLEMAKRYWESIQEVAPHGPYYLAGWSLGGMIAYEIARLIEQKGEKVAFLGLLDTHALDASDDQSIVGTRKDSIDAWALLLGLKEEELNQMDEMQKMNLILKRAKALNMVPEAAQLDTVKRYLRVMAANKKAGDTYIPGQPIQSDIYLFCAQDISPVNPIPLVDAESWRLRTTGNVHVVSIPGDHHRLVESPFVHRLSEEMSKIIASL